MMKAPPVNLKPMFKCICQVEVRTSGDGINTVEDAVKILESRIRKPGPGTLYLEDIECYCRREEDEK